MFDFLIYVGFSSVPLFVGEQFDALSGPFLDAISVMTQPVNILFIVLATILGLVIGSLPGLGGPVTLALLLGLTFTLEPTQAIMIMSAALGGGNFGGSITAILLNTPGAAPNAATVLDGFPLAKRGKASTALTASAVASAGGAIFGLVLFIVLLPFLLPIALAFGSIEFFWLAIFGLVVIAVATTESILSDLIIGAFGLILAFHGQNQTTGQARFTWGTEYLFDGIVLIPAIIGLFAVAEMISLVSQNTSISEISIKPGGKREGIRSVFENRGTFFRSAGIGWFIGLIPGVGGTVANFVAYLQAKQTSDNPEEFGKGEIAGVIASEASNDAKDGGSMLPTLVLGIPGSSTTAVLLGAFVLHGITPGPVILSENMTIVFIVILSLLVSNILTSLFGLAFAEQLAKFTRVPIRLLAPAILVIALAGAFVVRGRFHDLTLAVAFGVFGFALIRLGISRIPVIIALILGPIAEANFHRALQLSGNDYGIFFSRPLSVAIVFMILFVLAWPLIQAVRNRPDSGAANG